MRTNPWSSRSTESGSHSVCGRAPIMTNRPSACDGLVVAVGAVAEHEMLEPRVPATTHDLGVDPDVELGVAST